MKTGRGSTSTQQENKKADDPSCRSYLIGRQFRHYINNTYRLHVGGILVAAVYNVVNLHVLIANCCVWNYTPVEKHVLRITLA